MIYSNHIGGCQIWPNYGGTSYWNRDTREIEVEHSPRAGGKYRITCEAVELIKHISTNAPQRAQLTTLLVDQREEDKIKWPRVTPKLIEEAKKTTPLQVPERADRLLRYIEKCSSRELGEWIPILDSTNPKYLEALAWSESTGWREVVYLCEHLSQEDYIRLPRFEDGSPSIHVMLTVNGYSRVANQIPNSDSFQAFVAMWFDETMREASKSGVEQAILDAGYEPLRIDRKKHNNKIDDEITLEISRSRFLVADFTHGEDGARGSVYYEAGFARGIGIPAFYTCRKDLVTKLPFDTRQFNHVLWETHDELREGLSSLIVEVMGKRPKPPTH